MRDPQAWGRTLLRITLGIIFVMHGYLAFLDGAHATARFITKMGWPQEFSATLAWYLIVAHVVGGVLLVLGYWTRLAAFAQLPILLSAVLMLHWRQGFSGLQFPVLVLVATVAIVLLGPGTLALDRTTAGGGGRRRGV
jgi:putative oxidoreductase